MEDETQQEVLDTELARIEAIDAGHDVFRQFRTSGALSTILLEARDRAVDALNRLVKCDPFNAAAVRDLQWEVTRYDALCQFINEIVETARNASEDLTAEEGAALEQMLRGDESEPKDE